MPQTCVDPAGLARSILHLALTGADDDHTLGQIRDLACDLSTAILDGPVRDSAHLVFSRNASDRAYTSLAAYCASKRRFTSGQGVTAHLVPFDEDPLRAELVDVDLAENGGCRIVVAPLTGDLHAPPARTFDVYSDLARIELT